MNIVLYTSETDTGLEDLQKLIDEFKAEYEFQLSKINIDAESDVYKDYIGRTPALEVGPYHLYSPFSRADIKMTLGAASDRQKRLEVTGDPIYQKRIERGREITGADKFSLWLTRQYMWIFNIAMLIFVGLPFMAPVFEKIGAPIPAKIIYTIYSPLCHQFGFRSWFLYGEQSAYPRELAGLSGISFEKATGISPLDVLKAKAFIGNEVLGYKVAICERDVAIYGGILFFGLLFTATGRRMKSIPWYFWIILGILPMGVDGVSQLPGLILSNLSWIPIRESTPLLRTITGLLFGLTTAWFGYPYIEESMKESRKVLLKKFAFQKETV